MPSNKDAKLANSVSHVTIINPKSSYVGRTGKVVARYWDGDVRVVFDERPDMDLRFFPSEYEVAHAGPVDAVHV